MKIHPTAIVDPKAELAQDVEVGVYSNIGKNVVIGPGTRIGPRVTIEGWTEIGRGCRIFTGAVLGSISQDLKYKGDKSRLVIGNDNTIREYVTVNMGSSETTLTTVGSRNLFMAYAHVAHDCLIKDEVVLANAATLAGHVLIEDGAVIGGLVAIHQFTRVGTMAIVGGCSKVVKDVPPYSLVDGHPTRVYGSNAVGLSRSNISAKVRSDLKHAFKILCNSGLSVPTALTKIKEEIESCPEIKHLIEFIKTSKRGVCR